MTSLSGVAGKEVEQTAGALILIIGSINADVYLDIPRLPHVGETISADSQSGEVTTGGKGANTAVAVSLLRAASTAPSSSAASVRFIGQFGSDSHRAMLTATLDDMHVEQSLCRVREDTATGAAFIMRQPGGHNSIILLGGANQSWPSPPFSDDSLAAIRQASLILLQREIPDAVNEAVAAVLKERLILLDVGGSSSPLSPSLLSRVLFLAPNETELAGLTGRSTESVEEMREAAEQAQKELDVPYLLVTMGERGSFLFLPKSSSPASPRPSFLHCPAFPVSVVDTTGAGDTFRGAFAVSFAALPSSSRTSHSSLVSCMRFAAAASALSCTKPGTIKSIPTRTQVEAFLTEHAHSTSA